MADSEQSREQDHILAAVQEAYEIPGVSGTTIAKPIKSAGVVGCGTMGAGIAMCFGEAGIPVRIFDKDAAVLEKGLARITTTCSGSAKRGRITKDTRDSCIGLISGTDDLAGFKDADIVIEAVFEDIDLKKQVFLALDEICNPDAILASNTSTLDINDIAAATVRPDKVIGTHFFSPAHVMRLMENVRGSETSPETIATVMALSKKLGKTGVLVGVCDGFAGNRMYHRYIREAGRLLEEGALPEQVDRVIRDFGFKMGPFAVGDIAGLDVGWRIRKARAEKDPTGDHAYPIADRICEQGRFGQKTGAGWYAYEEGGRTPISDPAVEEIIINVSQEFGITRRDIGDDEILERCLQAIINEGKKILEEGIALRPGDLDVIWVFGYGFPADRGGPMYYADRTGLL